MDYNMYLEEILNGMKATKGNYIPLIELFTSHDSYIKGELLDFYTKVMVANNLKTTEEAKVFACKNVFKDYLNQEMNRAQDSLDEDSNGYVADEIVNNIKLVKKLFANGESVTFKDYLLQTIEGINLDEINAIFEKETFTKSDVKYISKFLGKVFNKDHEKSDNYALSFINHELLDLAWVSRKKRIYYNENNFKKYSVLAKALLEFNKNEKKEGFDRAIAYLVNIDLKYGLKNIKTSSNEEYTELIEISKRIESNEFDKTDIVKLMNIAVTNSHNFKDDGFGNIQQIQNSGTTLRLAGVADGVFLDPENGDLLVHSVSGKENNQVGRAAQLKLENERDSQIPVSVQIGDSPAIPRDITALQEDNENKTYLTIREQLILSYATNFSYHLSMVANNVIGEELLDKGPLELYANCTRQSKQFMSEYLLTEDKINEYVQSFINVIDKNNILGNTNSTSMDKRNEHIMSPLKEITNSLIELYEENPMRYGQTLSNLKKLILDNENNILTGNMTLVSDFKALKRILNSIDLVQPCEVKTSLSSIKSDDDDNSLEDIVFKLSNDIPKLTMRLTDYLTDNLDKISLMRFTSNEIEALESLPEETKTRIMPILELLAMDALEEIDSGNIVDGKRKPGRPFEVEILEPVVKALTHENKDLRNFHTSDQTTPAKRKVYGFFRDDRNSKAEEHLDVFATLAYITGGRLSCSNNNHIMNNRLKI